jgi:hypothetical protein
MSIVTTGSTLPEILTRREVATYLRCAIKTVKRRKIRCIRIGGMVRYRREDVLAIINPEASQ